MADFKGPLDACRALDSLADDIGTPIVEIINSRESIAASVKHGLVRDIEALLVEVFTGTKVFDIRDYMHAEYRDRSKVYEVTPAGKEILEKDLDRNAVHPSHITSPRASTGTDVVCDKCGRCSCHMSNQLKVQCTGKFRD